MCYGGESHIDSINLVYELHDLVYLAGPSGNGTENAFGFGDRGWGSVRETDPWDEAGPGRMWGLWGQSKDLDARGVA